MASDRVQRRIDALLVDAALSRRDWQMALESAEAALGTYPENTEAISFMEASRRAVAAAASSSDTVAEPDINQSANDRHPEPVEERRH